MKRGKCEPSGFLHDEGSFMYCRISEAEKQTSTTGTLQQMVQREAKVGCVDQSEALA